MTRVIILCYITGTLDFFVGKGSVMKVRCSLKSAKMRDKDCKVVRRKGRVYVINKRKPKFKARQG